MASGYSRIVDRQLACARFQLDMARASDKRFSRTVCLNASSLHLAEALLAYLHELPLNSCGALQNASPLLAVFNELKYSTEAGDFRVNEIITLAFSRQSWMDNLIQLQRFFRKPTVQELSAEQERKRQAVETQPAMDKFIATSANPSSGNLSSEREIAEPSIDLIAEIIEELGNLVARHREFSAEY